MFRLGKINYNFSKTINNMVLIVEKSLYISKYGFYGSGIPSKEVVFRKKIDINELQFFIQVAKAIVKLFSRIRQLSPNNVPSASLSL